MFSFAILVPSNETIHNHVGNKLKKKMKIKIKIILILLFISSINLYACNCKYQGNLEVLQNIEFNNSECIFIGEVIDIDSENNVFEVIIIESFNGIEIGEIYSGLYDKYCGPIINEKGKWLIYGNFNSENQIVINHCGLSRSFENPENNTSASNPPEPLLPNTLISKSESESEKRMTEWKKRAKSDLDKEIIYLRKRIK